MCSNNMNNFSKLIERYQRAKIALYESYVCICLLVDLFPPDIKITWLVLKCHVRCGHALVKKSILFASLLLEPTAGENVNQIVLVCLAINHVIEVAHFVFTILERCTRTKNRLWLYVHVRVHEVTTISWCSCCCQIVWATSYLLVKGISSYT